ncbi:MAG: ATP synthase F1 subunit delta [Desulfovibrionaceae bacterium]|nr:ATP synthase F1 subunit delta [Desulfovibrionaceae bacterium]
MTDTRIARRYASAVFKLGMQEGSGVTAKRGKMLKELEALLDANAALDNVFKSPIFTVDEKKKVLADLLNKIGSDNVTRNFCYLLADKDRLPYYRSIVAAYTKLLDQATGVIRGTLTTAIPLTQAKQKSVKAELEAKAGATLELAFDVDPSILGGVVLKVGDRILDSSLRAQLEILRGTLKRGN